MIASSGCRWLRRGIFRPPGPTAPTVLNTMPTAMDIVGAVNANTARVQSYYTNSARFSVPGVAGLPLLQGNIALERPMNFRLTARLPIGSDEIDLGSNNELLWFWVKQNSPPALYFCRHDQFATSGAKQMLPVDPNWIGDALGLVELNPDAQYVGPIDRGDGSLELRSQINSPTGPMTRSVVIDATRAWVLEQYLYDSTGQLVASAKASDFRYDEAAKVSLPREVTIRVPASELTLTIDVGNVVVNVPVPNRTLMYSPPSLANYPRVDLGSVPAGMALDPSIVPPQTVVPNQPEPTAYAPPPAAMPAVMSTVGPVSYPAPVAVPQLQGLPPGGVAIEQRGP